jgi:hypothetical protein
VRSECPRAQDVLDALAAQRWPSRAGAELRAHVDGCHVCRDLAAVAGALLEAQDVAWSAVRVPPAPVVWWRAQLRARDEAARRASRPIAIVEAAAAVAAFLLVAALLGGTAPEVQAWAGRAWDVATPGWIAAAPPLPPVLTSGRAMPALVIGAWLVLAPLAIYFAVAGD